MWSSLRPVVRKDSDDAPVAHDAALLYACSAMQGWRPSMEVGG